jgi:hypothetical protein
LRRLWKAVPALAAAAVLLPAAAGADSTPAPASDDVDIITPDYFTPMPQVPVGGVLGAQKTIRAVDARGKLAAGGSFVGRVEGTGSDAGHLTYVDRAAGIDLASTFIVSLRFAPRGATITGVAKNRGVPVSFTVTAQRSGRLSIALSNGYARSGVLQGRLVVG